MEINLTQGSEFKTLVKFSLPFLLANFLQTLYGMADLFIAGQFNGSEIITAVSVGSQIMHMLTVIIVGLSMGSTVLIGRAVGAKDSKGIKTVISSTIIVFTITALILTAITVSCCPLIVKLVSTPPEAIEQTKIYLWICFAGIPFITAYNVIAAVFRGLGDSKSPMIFISISCVINIALDYLFMGYFKMEAGGAAIATVLAQTISVAISLIAVIKLRKNKIVPASEKTSIVKSDKKCAGEILKIGLPVAVQDGFIQISFLVITIIANSRGVDVAASVGVVEKIICFLFLVPSAMLSSVSAIAAQNYGANEPKRAKKTLYYGILIGVCSGLIFAILFQFISEPVIYLFSREENVIKLGSQYMHSYVFDCVFAAIHFSFSGYFCACKKSIYAFIHNIISIILIRIPGAYLASIIFPQTLFPMGLAATTGSLLSSFICFFIFISPGFKKSLSKL